jgi:hypothetical protein
MANDVHSSGKIHFSHTKKAKNVHPIHDDVYIDHPIRSVHHVVYPSHVMVASFSHASYAKATHARPRHNVHNTRPINVPKVKKNASTSPSISYHTHSHRCKDGRVVASHVRPKRKDGKTCVWVPKVYVTNLTGPNSGWVPKRKNGKTCFVGLCIRGMKRPDPLGLKCDTITSPRRLVTTFLTSNSTEFE